MIKSPVPGVMILAFLLLTLLACEKSQYKSDSFYTARIVGFDLNCSTCILEFPDDNSQVRKEIGESIDNRYEAINLNKGIYEEGQMLKVKVRNPNENELIACLTLYPSYNYKNIIVTETEEFNDLVLKDTVSLAYLQCLYNTENQSYICLDSVLTDSRCPAGAYCFWEGNAEVRFKYEKFNNVALLFILNTYRGFTTDTIIDGYKIRLAGLSNHSLSGRPPVQKDYRALIIVSKNK